MNTECTDRVNRNAIIDRLCNVVDAQHEMMMAIEAFVDGRGSKDRVYIASHRVDCARAKLHAVARPGRAVA